MRAHLILSAGLAALAVTACNPPAEKAEAPAPAAAPETPVAATPVSAPRTLEDACRTAVNTMYGQEGGAVTFELSSEGVATVTWRAPVDGGRLTFQCTTDGDRVSLSNDSRQVSVNLSTNAVAPAAQQEAR